MDREVAEERGFRMILVGIGGGAIVSTLLTVGFALFWPSASVAVSLWPFVLLVGPLVVCVPVGMMLMIYGAGGLRACAIAACLVLAAACVFLLPLGLHQAALHRWSLWEAVSGWGDWSTLLVAFFCGWYLGHDSRRRNRGEEQQ